MMFLKIIPVYRVGANTPPETGPAELVRFDLIRRACPASMGGIPCVKLTLDGDARSGELVIHCTGTIDDLVASIIDEPDPAAEPEPEPEEEDELDADCD
ncbi:MAG TPA: hypothetical protein VMY37_06840 [Thermoguttaceae bacterium]|nr:hypothetical protein [Thermoguttaceae bacterium]